MAEKKTNEILEEQRRARQEFLNLKKMQQGQMYAGPKPSETATIPKTPKEKFKHFWEYSKWYVIFGTLLAALIAFLVVQCATKTEYDLKVVYFTYDTVLDEQIKPIEKYLSKYSKDLNGDGEVNIQLINCSVSDKNMSIASRNTSLQKMQSIIVAEKNALLFILDDRSVKYFDNLDGGLYAMFEKDTVLLDEEFYKETKHKDFGTLPDNLTLYCRKVSGTTIEKEKDVAEFYKESKNIINKLKEKK